MTLIDWIVRRLLDLTRWLSLPVALLLFLQWPLRDGVQAWSRETNDLGQWLFALFVAASIVAAMRAREHIATDVLSALYPAWWRKALLRVGRLVGLIPWTLFVVWAAAPMIGQSVALLEHFPDTNNPGYFMVKVALGLLCVIVLLQALLDLRGDAS